MSKRSMRTWACCGALQLACALPAMDVGRGDRPSAGAAGVLSTSQGAQSTREQGGLGGAFTPTAANGGSQAASAGSGPVVVQAGGSGATPSSMGVGGTEQSMGGTSSSMASLGGSSFQRTSGFGATATTSVSAAGAVTAGAGGVASSSAISAPSGCNPIHFADTHLETYVRRLINKSDGDLSWDDVKNEPRLSTSDAPLANLVKNLDGIQCLTGLTKLVLYGEAIDDVAPLAKLTQLQELDLEANLLSSIEPLRSLTKLRTLSVGRNASLTNLAPVAGMTSLVELDAGICAIDSLDGVKSHPHLEVLLLNDNALSGSADFGSIPSLKRLDLSGSNLTSTDGMLGLTSLQELVMTRTNGDNSQLIDIDALGSLTSLVTLNLMNNPHIASFSALSSLTKLDKLLASNCGLTGIAWMEALTTLTVLDLHANDITSIAQLEHLTLLRELDLSWNHNLAVITPLVNNPGLGAGDTINVSSCAINCVNSAGDIAALETRGAALHSGCQ